MLSMGVIPFCQSETTTTTRLLQFILEAEIQNNLGTFQGETGVTESKRKYKKRKLQK